MTRSPPAEGTAASRWPGHAAAAALFAFALVSFYWAAGGTTGVSTLGGSIEEQALARDPTLAAITWVTALLKTAAAVLALALVRSWGRRLPRRWLLLTAWGAAATLTAYGVLQFTGVALVALDVVSPTEPKNTTVLLWRLLLWEPWFILCGLLLGLAARRAHERPGRA